MTNWEIDALVATDVMGWTLRVLETVDAWVDEKENWTLKQMWRPSTNISDAWQVVEKMREEGIYLDIQTYADFFQVTIFSTCAVSLPSISKAICLAALKTKGVEIE